MRRRADQLLVERGLCPSRAQARAAIAAGLVTADGSVVDKPSALLAADCTLAATPVHPWVSRGGMKLAAALDAFAIDPAGRLCLDLGASTGGFTDVLLARGAARVVAVDVGRDQLHPRLRADPRVLSLEGRDARALTGADLTGAPGLLVADLSFIALLKAIGPALDLAAPGADLVALVKPQFEAGPGAVGKGGIVGDPAVRTAVRDEAAAGLAGLGWPVRGVIESPIRGGDGNVEFLLAARRTPEP